MNWLYSASLAFEVKSLVWMSVDPKGQFHKIILHQLSIQSDHQGCGQKGWGGGGGFKYAHIYMDHKISNKKNWNFIQYPATRKQWTRKEERMKKVKENNTLPQSNRVCEESNIRKFRTIPPPSLGYPQPSGSLCFRDPLHHILAKTFFNLFHVKLYHILGIYGI